MNILTIGSGKMLYFLCRSFLAKGHKVTVIDGDQSECIWLARRSNATVIYGDGTKPQMLEEAGANTADAALAITPDDHDNLSICQIASIRFGVPHTLALVNDPDNETVFKQLGVNAVSITRILSDIMEQKVSLDSITNLVLASEGKVNITEIVLKDTYPVIGKELRNIEFPENSLIAYMLRNDQPFVPRGNSVLQAGDRIFIVTLPENYGQVIRMLTEGKE